MLALPSDESFARIGWIRTAFKHAAFEWQYLSAHTWQTPSGGTAPTVVVIQSEADQPIPAYLAKRIDDYHLQKEFADTSGVFRFSTIVRIYLRA